MNAESDDGKLSDSPLAELKQAAIAAAKQAWCPYSRFPVGAAILVDLDTEEVTGPRRERGTGLDKNSTHGTCEEQIATGCNVENASFGLTVCAERHAVAAAVARGCRRFRALLVYTPTSKPATPCGACRQVIAEFSPDAELLCTCDGPDILRISLRELLPHSFGPESFLTHEGRPE